jgi:hypothetical protein
MRIFLFAVAASLVLFSAALALVVASCFAAWTLFTWSYTSGSNGLTITLSVAFTSIQMCATPLGAEKVCNYFAVTDINLAASVVSSITLAYASSVIAALATCGGILAALLVIGREYGVVFLGPHSSARLTVSVIIIAWVSVAWCALALVAWGAGVQPAFSNPNLITTIIPSLTLPTGVSSSATSAFQLGAIEVTAGTVAVTVLSVALTLLRCAGMFDAQPPSLAYVGPAEAGTTVAAAHALV